MAESNRCKPPTRVAEIDPVRALAGLLQREAVEDFFRLAEPAAPEQRGAEERERARVLGRKAQCFAAQCFGGFELAAAERLSGVLDEGSTFDSAADMSDSPKKRAAWFAPRGPLSSHEARIRTSG